MNVPNLNQKTLLQILPAIQKQYPEAHIKKTFFGAEIIQVPYEKFQFLVRNRMSRRTGNVFSLGFQPPMSWIVSGVAIAVILSVFYSIVLDNKDRIVISIGAAMLAAIVLFIVKAIFRSKNKKEIEQFNKHFIIEQFNKNFIDVVINIRKEYN